jgi:hypothetical protein
MNDRPIGAGMKCEEFLEKLEELPGEMPGGATAGAWRESLSAEAREHAFRCANCAAALEDFVETRKALGEMKAGLPEPGPWFVSRVMARIRAQEREMEEQANGVWINVMRLGPRLAALAVVALVLGGTWALELRWAAESRQKEIPPVEGLFESAPSAPVNDDIVASTYAERQP